MIKEKWLSYITFTSTTHCYASTCGSKRICLFLSQVLFMLPAKPEQQCYDGVGHSRYLPGGKQWLSWHWGGDRNAVKYFLGGIYWHWIHQDFQVPCCTLVCLWYIWPAWEDKQWLQPLQFKVQELNQKITKLKLEMSFSLFSQHYLQCSLSIHPHICITNSCPTARLHH